MRNSLEQISADAHQISALCHKAEDAALTALAATAEMMQKMAHFARDYGMSATDARPALMRAEAAMAGHTTALAKIGETHMRIEKDLAEKITMDVPLTCPDGWRGSADENVFAISEAA